MFLMLILLVSRLGLNDVARDDVDLIELNHYYDEHGKRVFEQLIFYDWSVAESRYHVRAWRALKCSAQIPRRDWRTGGYFVIWRDGDLLRNIRARAVHETWTQYDPEFVERQYFPKEKRRELKTNKEKARSQ